jgi:hypothetical protein
MALVAEETPYYDDLSDKLDLILTFTEHGWWCLSISFAVHLITLSDACDQQFPFTILQDLLESHTITSCSHIFSWIEARAQRLTEGLVPQKGKALVLLRTLNDLLRRLSKMGNTTIFCGRILTFLSGVFPLGERSGVNLRGEYGPVWEGVKVGENDEKEQADIEANEAVGDADKMQIDETRKEEGETKKAVPTLKNKKEGVYCCLCLGIILLTSLTFENFTTLSGPCSYHSLVRHFSPILTRSHNSKKPSTRSSLPLRKLPPRSGP